MKNVTQEFSEIELSFLLLALDEFESRINELKKYSARPSTCKNIELNLGFLASSKQKLKHKEHIFTLNESKVMYTSVHDRRDFINAALDDIEKVWDIPDILVNNAGLDTQPSAPKEVSGPFEDFPEEVFREVVNINLVGTFLAVQAVGARMAKKGKGSIINVGSIYGMVSPIQDIYAYKKEKTGVPFIKPVAYSAAKSGVYNFTRYCATYWAKKGVRVNTLTPSGVFRADQDKEFQANYCARIPIGRMANADEYNGAMIFLASDASVYMTGSNLIIDGGWTAV